MPVRESRGGWSLLYLLLVMTAAASGCCLCTITITNAPRLIHPLGLLPNQGSFLLCCAYQQHGPGLMDDDERVPGVCGDGTGSTFGKSNAILRRQKYFF
jgi:hypothetical protein